MRNISLFVEDYAHMDIERVAQIDKSIERLLRALKRQFRVWQETQT